MQSDSYCSWVVCLSVCLSVCVLVNISSLEHPFVLKSLSHTQRATKVNLWSCSVAEIQRFPHGMNGYPSLAIFRYAETQDVQEWKSQ